MNSAASNELSASLLQGALVLFRSSDGKVVPDMNIVNHSQSDNRRINIIKSDYSKLSQYNRVDNGLSMCEYLSFGFSWASS